MTETNAPRTTTGYQDQRGPRELAEIADDATTKLAASQDRVIDLLLAINSALEIIDAEIARCPFQDVVLVQVDKILRGKK